MSVYLQKSEVDAAVQCLSALLHALAAEKDPDTGSNVLTCLTCSMILIQPVEYRMLLAAGKLLVGNPSGVELALALEFDINRHLNSSEQKIVNIAKEIQQLLTPSP